MQKHTYFISDIHLMPEAVKTTQWFIDFIRGPARSAEALYILGDFFEVWVGDDNNTAFNQQIKTELLAATQAGLPIYLMWGNRDFLIEHTFCQQTGVKLIPDPTTISLYGKTYLLMHGDSLCTDDIKHQRFRRASYNSLYRFLFLHLPLSTRLAIGKKIRQKSQRHHDQYGNLIADVNQQALAHCLESSDVDCIIHGHTHRPTIEAHRIVLGSWHNNPSILQLSENKQIIHQKTPNVL
jgi:UDP-2,3-diacylglucosamine hydrolase